MRPISVLDFGAHTVIVLIARQKKSGEWEVLGGGDVQAQGAAKGEIVHTGDAAECVTEAIRRAEISSGEKVRTLYYNFDHASIQTQDAHGTKYLIGEGQIRGSDIHQAKDAALRMASSFEKNTIYVSETGFLIDEKDRVLNPLGIYGQRLDVFLRVVSADSKTLDDWNKVMRRSYVAKSIPVLSAYSTALAVVPRAERIKKNLLLDLGDDFFNVILFENHGVKHCVGFDLENLESVAQEWLKNNETVEELLITNDQAKDDSLFYALKESVSVPVRRVSSALPRLNDLSLTAAAGILEAAYDMEKDRPAYFEGRNLFSNLKDKAASTWNEYF